MEEEYTCFRFRMDQSKKAIGFFVSLGILVLGYLLVTTKQIEAFSDFALLEWQIKLALQGKFYLPYDSFLQDPNFQFFPLPDLFFHVHKGFVYSTFPNFYPIFSAPFYAIDEQVGIRFAQFILFFLSIYIFYQIKKDKLATVLLLFGSSISLYIFLIHDTILFFFLEISILFLFHRRWTVLPGILSICLVWMRPEMVFSIFLILIFFSKEKNWKKIIITFIVTGFVFSIVNKLTLGTFFPLRLVKSPKFNFNADTSFFLFKILLEQIPIFILFIFYLIKAIIRKKNLYQYISLILITFLLVLISPNTGGHNTPRYFYGLFPLYILLFRENGNETTNTKLTKTWGVLCFILAMYQINLLFQKSKELTKISKYQTNTVQMIRKIKDKVLVFNNSDFSFVSLPALETLPNSEAQKELLLLRPNFSKKTFIQILTAKNANSFVFLELPPSPIPLGPIVSNPNNRMLGEYKKGNQYQLPDALLPIQITEYKRQ
ncbi:hypothetical protein [Leptospira meyeri]|uniref:hypothetical protein n=1 Tax=Leptospira meyeri TaxID=29508 RepID=UPI000C2A8B9E|nr:hypothetical protein [Leptospira meyeri]PJZ79951.1 hypothetical protein CH359_15635 [Leptospira meyeri]PJZ96090.1 hypothetical protein CH358_14270 [Leptospira meyeri]